jgi:hypothetical protein
MLKGHVPSDPIKLRRPEYDKRHLQEQQQNGARGIETEFASTNRERLAFGGGGGHGHRRQSENTPPVQFVRDARLLSSTRLPGASL